MRRSHSPLRQSSHEQLLWRTDYIMGGHLLTRVQRGAARSPYTPGRIVELLKAQGFLP